MQARVLHGPATNYAPSPTIIQWAHGQEDGRTLLRGWWNPEGDANGLTPCKEHTGAGLVFTLQYKPPCNRLPLACFTTAAPARRRPVGVGIVHRNDSMVLGSRALVRSGVARGSRPEQDKSHDSRSSIGIPAPGSAFP